MPYTDCRVRTESRISWPGIWIEHAIDRAEAASDSILLTHSHPTGFHDFSTVDDESDKMTIPSLRQAVPTSVHGSAIMTPDGAIKARLYQYKSLDVRPTEVRVVRVGQSIHDLSPSGLRPILAFSDAMRGQLIRQTACVVGVSGTGSIVAEILARLAIGCMILIDHDHIEKKNLNRIVNSKLVDAESKAAKVSMMDKAIRTYRDDVDIIAIKKPMNDPVAIETASGADILFSCVDSAEGRLYCDLIAQAASIPLIDVGVTIPTRQDQNGDRHVADVCGRIDYVMPGGSSLQDRLVVTPEALHREYILNHAPEEANARIREGYLKGTPNEAPSVISLNMRAASAAVNEWIARMFDLRIDGNAPYARTLFSLAAMEEDYFPDASFECSPKHLLGRGLGEPLLGMPSFVQTERNAA